MCSWAMADKLLLVVEHLFYKSIIKRNTLLLGVLDGCTKIRQGKGRFMIFRSIAARLALAIAMVMGAACVALVWA